MTAGARRRESRLGMPHAQNDARCAATGRAPALAAGPDAGAELRRMNRGKNGRRYRYPESLIMLLAALRSYCGLSCRAVRGFAAGQLGAENAPHFTQIWRRINSLDVSISDGIVSVRGRSGVLNLAIDGTGMSPGARSEYIRVGACSATRSRGVNRARTRAVLEQLGGGIRDPGEFAELTKNEREANRRKWKELVGYGERWLAEIVISSFKRLFGDSVRAVRWRYVAQEMTLKVDLYNRLLRIQREAIAMA